MSTWSDEFLEAGGNPALTHLPSSYRDLFTPSQALKHSQVLPGLGEHSLVFDLAADGSYLAVMHTGEPMALSDVLPILHAFGLRVLDQHPYQLPGPTHLSVFTISPPAGSDLTNLTEAFSAAWFNRLEVDPLNSLVLTAGLNSLEVSLVRAYLRYLAATGASLGAAHLTQTFSDHPRVISAVVDLFRARLDLSLHQPTSPAAVFALLDSVTALDADRALRLLTEAVLATTRTNFFTSFDPASSALALKFDLSASSDLGELETWVFSPRVEGTHVRVSPISRGGIRNSDRRDDFRTEVLSLVQAQEVKNAGIIPSGGKGAFFSKMPPSPRSALLAYREYIDALLSVTDNRTADGLSSPVSALDDPDPYLVVAPDKGTASYSDVANSLAAERGFWLGDAFASGGSSGFDHRAMGITARGAMVSAERHFRSLGVDLDSETVSVAGIGDMSGDVFGNFMLLKPRMRLVAAFDHRHVFLDPHPDLEAAHAERERLFKTPGSSWADYDPALISPGGGVFPRDAKTVDISADMAEILGVKERSLTAHALIRAILTAPVDLLFNGGVGTYVKASYQSDLEVADKANDATRVNADQLRASVVVEGGNLGLTHEARDEASRAGVALTGDFVDNAAGVFTSDLEVNTKIALVGNVSPSERLEILAASTDHVASAVLTGVYHQVQALGNARRGAVELLSVHARFVDYLESEHNLVRSQWALPSSEGFASLIATSSHLSSSQLAALFAFAKISARSLLKGSSLASDPYLMRDLVGYFPPSVRAFADSISAHPLREEIVLTCVVNKILTVGGITFLFRLCEDTGASMLEATRAALIAYDVFDMDGLFKAINDLDNAVPADVQTNLHLEVRRLFDRSARWFLARSFTDLSSSVERFAPVLASYHSSVNSFLPDQDLAWFEARREHLTRTGATPDLAARLASSMDAFALLDVALVASSVQEPVSSVAPVYFTLSREIGVDECLQAVARLPRDTKYSALARLGLRSDLYEVAALAAKAACELSPDPSAPDQRVSAYLAAYPPPTNLSFTPELPNLLTSTRTLRAYVN